MNFIVPFEIANIMRSNGYDNPSTVSYNTKTKELKYSTKLSRNSECSKNLITAPTYLDAIEFLGERGIGIDFQTSYNDKFNVVEYIINITNYETKQRIENMRSFSLSNAFYLCFSLGIHSVLDKLSDKSLINTSDTRAKDLMAFLSDHADVVKYISFSSDDITSVVIEAAIESSKAKGIKVEDLNIVSSSDSFVEADVTESPKTV